ncbi:DUF2336 domain-containing protein [Phenylobacterium terrae]|uniref:DUF2336 domain-containing protein n=1 Tax=Phenylobacterium terrae TaxID=2665495 RepID=UPI00360B6D08
MSVAVRADDLLRLARSKAPADRERLLMAVVDLCATSDAREVKASRPIQDLLSSIFMTLVVEAERDIRRRLAEKLAPVDWAPVALINVLALDEIEIARPVIAQSPVLQDGDLVRLLLEATLEHQVEIARRPRLGEPVIAAILASQKPAVMTALAANTEIELTPENLSRLVYAARRIATLRAPLARRKDLTPDLARELYVWVGQSLRQQLAKDFRLNLDALDDALAEAVREAHGGQADDEGVIGVETIDAAAEGRLVGKLAAAGQLKPGYLMRALREGKLPRFISALAMLGDFDLDHVHRAVGSERPELLAMACAAVGIDRSAFPTVLGLVWKLNGGRPGGGGHARAVVADLPAYTPAAAAAAFREALQAA